MSDLARDARTSSRESFTARHRGFYLVPMPRARKQRSSAGTVPNRAALSRRPTEVSDVDAPDRVVVEVVEIPPFDRPLNVGRTDDNDVVLGDPTVSRRHAAFLVTNGRLELVDLGSRNGTRVRGLPLQPGESQRVAIGDDVRFGSINLVLADANLCWESLNDLG